MTKRCPCCGQVMPPKIAGLGPVKRAIYRELLIQPCSSAFLRKRVRPTSATNLYMHIKGLKEQLKPLGLTIKAEWRGTYRIAEL
jgi:hypothetical protein